jgi:hypothetical protein
MYVLLRLPDHTCSPGPGWMCRLYTTPLLNRQAERAGNPPRFAVSFAARPAQVRRRLSRILHDFRCYDARRVLVVEVTRSRS